MSLSVSWQLAARLFPHPSSNRKKGYQVSLQLDEHWVHLRYDNYCVLKQGTSINKKVYMFIVLKDEFLWDLNIVENIECHIS